MDKSVQKTQAKNSPVQWTSVFQCFSCKKGQMRLIGGVFGCNRCKKNVSKEEGIKHITETIDKIQNEDRFKIKNRIRSVTSY